MNLCDGYKLSNGMKLRKDKFWNKEQKLSEVCRSNIKDHGGKSHFQDYTGQRAVEYTEIQICCGRNLVL